MKSFRTKLYIFMLTCVFWTAGITVRAEECVVPDDVAHITEEVGTLYNVSPELLQAIAWSESRFQADAENAGCIGMMQINVVCHTERIERLQIKNLHDPYENILVAADYLSELLERTKGDIGKALMLYHGEADAFERRTLSDYATRIINLSDKLLSVQESDSHDQVQIYRTTWS